MKNRPRKIPACLAGVVLAMCTAAPAFAQQEAGFSPYWRATLSGGSYLVSHARIASISKSQYIVDGTIRVTEVAIDTTGSMQGRFYHAEPLTPRTPGGLGQSSITTIKDRVGEVAGRAGIETGTTSVVKNYPATTHAHTVEFHIDSLDTLDRLFKSLENSLLAGRNAEFRDGTSAE